MEILKNRLHYFFPVTLIFTTCVNMIRYSSLLERDVALFFTVFIIPSFILFFISKFAFSGLLEKQQLLFIKVLFLFLFMYFAFINSSFVKNTLKDAALFVPYVITIVLSIAAIITKYRYYWENIRELEAEGCPTWALKSVIETRIRRDNGSDKFTGKRGQHILTMLTSGVASAVFANHAISSVSAHNIVDVAKSSADHYFSGLRDNDSGLSIFSATPSAGMEFSPTSGLPMMTDMNMANPMGMDINPASGMPMMDGAMDISGNAFGMSESHFDPISSSLFDDSFSSISSGSSWDDSFGSSGSFGSGIDSGSSFSSGIDYDSGSSYNSGSSWDEY